MKFLGIDYGTKRIGLALSDEDGKLAFPKETLKNDGDALNIIVDLIKVENVGEVVVGDSTDFSGAENKIVVEVETFISQLAGKIIIPIRKQKEFLTSVEARRYGNSKGDMRKSVDAGAAALILQRYLDKINNKR